MSWDFLIIFLSDMLFEIVIWIAASHCEITQSVAFTVTQINFQLKYKCQLMYVMRGLEKKFLYIWFFFLRRKHAQNKLWGLELRGKTNLSSIQINFSELKQDKYFCWSVITHLRDLKFYDSLWACKPVPHALS